MQRALYHQMSTFLTLDKHLHPWEFLCYHLILQLADSAGGIQVLRANHLAIENSVTSENSKLRCYHSQTLVSRAVTGIIDEPQRLQQSMWAEIFRITVSDRT